MRPRSDAPVDVFRFAGRSTILAPSGHNTQPWLLTVRGDRLDVFPDRTRALPVVNPADRELIMSCGTALCHARTAVRHVGAMPGGEPRPETDDPDILARVRFGERRPTASTMNCTTAS